jgi:hypothetical protein
MKYHGVLTAWVPDIIRLYRQGLTSGQIAQEIRAKGARLLTEVHRGYDFRAGGREATAGLVRFILHREGIISKHMAGNDSPFVHDADDTPEGGQRNFNWLALRQQKKDHAILLWRQGCSFAEIGRQFGLSPNTIRKWIWYGSERDFHVDTYRHAREDHAALLRCEGLTLREIGNHLGVDKERARQLVACAGRRWNRAMGKARFHLQIPVMTPL